MHLHIDNGNLKIGFSFWEKVWGFHGSFRIPLSHVREIKHEIPVTSWRELRIPGSFVPGVIKAGTYYTPRGKEFWYVTRWGKQFVTIELEHEKYRRIVLGLDEDEILPVQLGH
jgi:hypothetical protein